MSTTEFSLSPYLLDTSNGFTKRNPLGSSKLTFAIGRTHEAAGLCLSCCRRPATSRVAVAALHRDARDISCSVPHVTCRCMTTSFCPGFVRGWGHFAPAPLVRHRCATCNTEYCALCYRPVRLPPRRAAHRFAVMCCRTSIRCPHRQPVRVSLPFCRPADFTFPYLRRWNVWAPGPLERPKIACRCNVPLASRR